MFLQQQKQQKRKKALRNKIIQVSIFVVGDPKKGVPRGAHRKKLIDEKYSVKVELHQNMEPTQVKAAILREIKHLNLTSFTILECDGPRLLEASTQQPTGDQIIESALKRKGAVLYICNMRLEIRYVHVHVIKTSNVETCIS